MKLPRITAHTCENGQFFGPASSCFNLPPEGLLNWLTFSASTISPSPTKVVWNLSRFAKSVLSQLPDGVSRGLQRSPHRVKWNNYRLFYIPEKVFSVSKDGSDANFYDLSQYFPGEPEPETLDKLQEKATQLETALSELGIPDPPSLASPVACFNGQPLIKKLERDIPTIYDDDESVLDAYDTALACTPREWISNYQIGHFPELWKYDLSSAYPYWATQLPDLSDCSIAKADGVDLLADYGFFVGDITIFPDHPLAFCSPFLADRGDGVLVNFVGTRRDYPCTLDEQRTLYQYGLGSFQFKRGWIINELSSHAKRSFAEPFSELYNLRGDCELKSYLLKRVMNGIIGRLLEVRRDNKGNVLEYGSLFNPIYHALITSQTRLQVFDFIASYGVGQDDLVTIDVDGVRTTKRLPVPQQTGMGCWREPVNDPAFVFSPGGIASTTRNFKRTDYVKLLEECKSRPKAVRLGADKKDPIDLSRLFLTQTRGFPEMPENARDLLQRTYLSEPVDLGT